MTPSTNKKIASVESSSSSNSNKASETNECYVHSNAKASITTEVEIADSDAMTKTTVIAFSLRTLPR